MSKSSDKAKRRWARKRLDDYIRDCREYLGKVPETATVWAEDFELLEGQDSRVKLIKGPPRPPSPADRETIHRG